MTISLSGVISPPGILGTTEYVPSRCMFARKWSLVSCNVACSPSRMYPVPSEARIEATTGLQMSQPRPRPCRVTTSLNVRIPRTRMMSNSSCRVCSKCSHSAVDWVTPASPSSFFTSGTHDPQVVPARVHALTAATSVQPCSRIAVGMVSWVTALHEQIWALPGRALPSPAPAGASSASGGAGSGPPRVARNVGYALASPTSTPPSRVCASSESTSLAYTRVAGSVNVTSSGPSVTPNDATSTPSSLSLVLVSAPGKVAAPPSSRSATTSAITYPGATSPYTRPSISAHSPIAYTSSAEVRQ